MRRLPHLNLGRRYSHVALAISLIAPFFLAPFNAPASQADNPPRKILTGWIPYYSTRTSLASAQLNKDLIREVMPFWYTLKYNSKTSLSSVVDLYTPANPSIPMDQTLASLRSAGFSIIPTITDGTAKDVLAGLLAKPAARKQIIETITALVVQKQFDGIDLDFEGFAFVDANTTWSKTAPLWATFVKELSISLHAQNKLLSVSTPYVLDPAGAQKGYYVYNWAAIASSIDRLRIMTYDYSVSKAGPLGPITWTERTLQYAVKIMPASKVYIGIAGYGRDWVTSVSGVCPADVAPLIKTSAKASTFVMYKAQGLAATYGVVPQWNEKYAEMNFTYQKVYNGTTAGGLATSCTATRTAWYQDAKAYGIRAALVDKYRLGGISAWTLGMEEPTAMDAIRNVALQIAPDQVTANLTLDRNAIKYGDAILVNASFAIKDKSPMPNVVIEIQGKSQDSDTWRTITKATTDISGKISKYILVGKGTVLRAYSEETWERSKGFSNEIPVSVDRLLFVNAPASIRHGETLTVTGSLRPRTAGTFIKVEKLVAGKWQPFGTVIATDAQGAFTFNAPTVSRGTVTLRVSAAADAMWRLVSSDTFTVLLR